MTGRAPIPFHVVTGFLGAGKTTLINRLLRAADLSDALVMVNEWGEIGLDNLLYERLAGDAILVNGGCVCCALRGDLIDALRDALARRDSGALPRFGRIVLETTGLAEPAPILHALFADPGLATRLVLAGVTTVVDGVNGAATVARAARKRAPGRARRPARPGEDRSLPQAERAARLRRRDRRAPRHQSRRADPRRRGRRILGAGLFGHDGRAAGGTGSVPSAAAHRVKTFVFRSDTALDPVAFAQFLSVLGAMLGPRLLRLKGLFKLADRPETPILVDGVQHVFHPPRVLPRWPDADRSSRAVLIVEGRCGAGGRNPLGGADRNAADRRTGSRRARSTIRSLRKREDCSSTLRPRCFGGVEGGVSPPRETGASVGARSSPLKLAFGGRAVTDRRRRSARPGRRIHSRRRAPNGRATARREGRSSCAAARPACRASGRNRSTPDPAARGVSSARDTACPGWRRKA